MQPRRLDLRRVAARIPVNPAVAAGVLLLVLLGVYRGLVPSLFSWSQLGTLGNESGVVAIAAVGETIVVLCGGFDLSVGAVLSVANTVAATTAGSVAATGVVTGGGKGSDLKMMVIVLAITTGIGLTNGVLVAILRIPSIVATLAASFFWGGVALLILEQPGGFVSPRITEWFTGSVIGPIPSVFFVLATVIVLWLALKHTRLGLAIYAVGGDRDAAAAAGTNVRWTLLLAYSTAGFFYGLAGLFLSGQSGSGDPNIGPPVLLSVFAAVVIGGTLFGGGRGGAIGSILGAIILTLITNILFVLGVSSFYTDIFNGSVLLIAVLLMSLTEGGLAADWRAALGRRSVRNRARGVAEVGS